MFRCLFVVFVSCLIQYSGFSQEKINDYKYIVIPVNYEWQKSEDQYQANSLTKFLFNKYGYTAFLANEDLPEDLVRNRCLGLEAIVKDVKGGFLMTKIQIDLIDCKDQVIASSLIGKTKEKSFKKAYNIAIREAFKTYQSFDYSYSGKNTEIVEVEDTTSNEQEIERLKKEVAALKEKSKVEDNKPKKEVKVEKENKAEAIATLETSVSAVEQEVSEDMLYAQPINGGFQVVDTEPKKVMILLNYGIENSFLVKGKDAIVYKKGSDWIYVENDGTSIKTKVLNLKF